MSVLVTIRVDDKGTASIVKLGESAKKAQQQVEPLGDTLKKVFASTAVLIAADRLKNAIMGMSREALSFEQNMKRIKGIGGVTQGLDKMSNSVRNLALETEYSASAISSSMLDMVKAGFSDPSAVAKAMPNIVNLATTAMMDLNYAAENTVDILRAFNLGNEETIRVANVMANSLNMTTMNAADYFEAIKYVSSVSNAMNVSLEETSVMLGVLANAGIKGSQAGTSLRSILLNILQPNKAVYEGLKSMNLQGKSLTEVLVGLRERGLTVIDFLRTFDKTAITSTMVLSDPKRVTAYNNLVDSLKNQSMGVAEVSDITRQALIPQLKNLLNVANEVGISIFDAFGDKPQSVIVGIKDKLLELDKWVDNNQESIRKTAETMASLARVVVNLSGDALKQLLVNMDSLIRLSTILIGVKVLGGLPGLLKSIQGGFTGVGKSTSVFTTVLTRVNLIAAAITGLDIIINNFIDSQNRMIDNKAALTGSFDLESLKTQYQLYKNITDQHIELANAKKKMNETQNLVEREYWRKEIEAYTQGIAGSELELREATGDSLNTIRNVKDYNKALNEQSNLLKNIGVAIAKINMATYKSMQTPVVPGGTLGNVPDLSNLDITGLGTSKEKSAFEGWSEWELETYNRLAAAQQVGNLKSGDRITDFRITDLLEEPTLGESTEDSSDTIDKEIESLKNQIKQIEETKEAYASLRDSIWNLGQATVDIFQTINEKRLENTLETLEDEKTAIEDRYDAEINAASTSTFKKEQLEQERAQRLIEIENKITEEKRKAAQKQKYIDMAVASINLGKGVVSVLAETTGGPILRTAAALEIAALAGTYIAQMASINLRSGGYVDGPGNSTSDSIKARLSKGEYVLPADTVSSLGGPSGVQTQIERSTNYNRDTGAKIYIDTILGTEYYVRNELLPVLKKELKR